jgi:hypothetical protein
VEGEEALGSHETGLGADVYRTDARRTALSSTEQYGLTTGAVRVLFTTALARTMVSRRRIVARLAGAASAVGLSGCTQVLTRTGGTELDLPPNPRADELPARQHAFDDRLRTDEHGNSLPPRHHTLLLLDLRSPPTVEHARTVERAMRSLEAAFDWAPDGLFARLAWGSNYFDRLGELGRSPVEHPQVLSRTDEPALQRFDAMLALSSDEREHLRRAERAMFHGDDLPGTAVADRLGSVLRRVGRRTGFVGSGLPAAHADAEGISEDLPIDEEAPLFTGFKSSRRGTQASEDRVTIEEGPFAGGTTVHLSRLRLSLSEWFSLASGERAARMFSPGTSTEDAESFGTDVPFADAVRAHAPEEGVVGPHEKVARTRRDGEPIVLRRDFNTVDGSNPGLHFLSLQSSLADFRDTRKAMNGWYLRDESEAITDRRNNGILNFVDVAARSNFYLPPREDRAFPLL